MGGFANFASMFKGGGGGPGGGGPGGGMGGMMSNMGNMPTSPWQAILKAIGGGIQGALNPKGTPYGKITWGNSDANLATQQALRAINPPPAAAPIPGEAPTAGSVPSTPPPPVFEPKPPDLSPFPLPTQQTPGPPAETSPMSIGTDNPFWKKFSPSMAAEGEIVTRPTLAKLAPGEEVIPLNYRARAKVRPSAALAGVGEPNAARSLPARAARHFYGGGHAQP
jgi:hypothetical protein